MNNQYDAYGDGSGGGGGGGGGGDDDDDDVNDDDGEDDDYDAHLQYLGKLLLILDHDQIGSAVSKHIPAIIIIIIIIVFFIIIIIIITIGILIITVIIILTLTCTPLQSWLDRYRKPGPQQTRSQCLKHSWIKS